MKCAEKMAKQIVKKFCVMNGLIKFEEVNLTSIFRDICFLNPFSSVVMFHQGVHHKVHLSITGSAGRSENIFEMVLPQIHKPTLIYLHLHQKTTQI